MGSATLTQQARRAIREGRLTEARSLLRQVISEDPHNHVAWLLLARATPNKKLALQYIDRVRLLQPDSPLVQSAHKNVFARGERNPSRLMFSWRAASIAISAILFASLIAMIFSKSDWAQAIAVQYDDVALSAAAPSEFIAQGSDSQSPAAAVETLPENPAAGVNSEGEESSATATPLAEKQPEQETENDVDDPVAGADESQTDVSQAAINSNPVQGLPAAILSGLAAEEGPQKVEEKTTESAADIDVQDDMVIKESGSTARDDSETIAVDETVYGDFTVASGAYSSLLPSGVAPGERWIDVNLTTQTLVAYEGEEAVLNSLISSGMWQFPTVTGQFQTWIKYESQNMTGYHLGYNYSIPDVPYVMYFYEDYAIHGAYWHNSFGTPMSHGCVNMNTVDAGWLFNWAPLGTIVNVHS